jgi:hypothetical protein
VAPHPLEPAKFPRRQQRQREQRREEKRHARRAVAAHKLNLKATFETGVSLYRFQGLKPGAFKLLVKLLVTYMQLVQPRHAHGASQRLRIEYDIPGAPKEHPR